VALLDVLTGGRVDWGAGRGFDPTEFEAFGAPLDEAVGRFREAVEVVRAAWVNDRLTFHGEYWHFDHVEMLPKPGQLPGPPTLVAAMSLGAVSSAASKGHLILMDPHASFSEIGQVRALRQPTGRPREAGAGDTPSVCGSNFR
jgi:alkanesulfonate monooxygenase SsuD/methylene tetrahydromethanopterin reductase-like flavin-dependent oxidoreductase (luciferase family)